MHSKGSATASGSGGCIEAVERSASLVEDALLNVDSGSEMSTKIQNTTAFDCLWGINVIRWKCDISLPL